MAIVNGLYFGVLLGYALWRVTDHYLQPAKTRALLEELGEFAKVLEQINKGMGWKK